MAENLIFIDLTLTNGQKTSIRIDDIIEVRSYTGLVNTWRMVDNDKLEGHPFKMEAGEPNTVNSGSLVFIRNQPIERVVFESHSLIMDKIRTLR